MAEQDAESFAGEGDVELLKFPTPTPTMVYCKHNSNLMTSCAHHSHYTMLQRYWQLYIVVYVIYVFSTCMHSSTTAGTWPRPLAAYCEHSSCSHPTSHSAV